MENIIDMIMEFENSGYTLEQIATITGYDKEEIKEAQDD